MVSLLTVLSRYGVKVFERPYVVIPVTLVICGLCSIGLTKMGTETRDEKLWMADGTYFQVASKWVSGKNTLFTKARQCYCCLDIAENYPEQQRYQFAIVYTEDGSSILTKERFAAIWELRKAIGELKARTENGTEVSFWTECKKVPKTAPR